MKEGQDYFAVALDGRPIKTLYTDDLLIPSRPLALALAAEWDEQLDSVDLRGMSLNTMVAKGVKARKDETLVAYMLR